MSAHMGSLEGSLAPGATPGFYLPLSLSVAPCPSDQLLVQHCSVAASLAQQRGLFRKQPLVAMVTAALGCEWDSPSLTKSRMADLHLRRPKACSSPGVGKRHLPRALSAPPQFFQAIKVRSPHYVLTPMTIRKRTGPSRWTVLSWEQCSSCSAAPVHPSLL